LSQFGPIDSLPPIPEPVSAPRLELPPVVEKPIGNLTRTVGTRDCDWQQIFAPLEKDADFSAIWSGASFLGGSLF
jgi:hypothetical protein